MISEVGRGGRQWFERVKGDEGGEAGPRIILKAKLVIQFATIA